MHHTLGNGEYDLFRRMSEPVVCASVFEALYHRRPVYMAFPADLAGQLALGDAQPIAAPGSNPDMLRAATDAIAAAVDRASTACVLPGILVTRTGLCNALQTMIDSSGLPFATMFMAKSVLDDQHPAYAGMYDGALINEKVRRFVEDSDLVINVGAPMTDFNTGAFTAHLDPAKTITIGHHRTQVNGKTYNGVEIGDLLAALAQRLPKRVWPTIRADSLGPVTGGGNDPIGVDALYPRWAGFLEPDDILVAETGTPSMGLGFARMPKGSTFHNQTLWGSIGWATPAAFGAAVAAPGRRVVLVTGDGSHQLTAQEIGQFARLGLKPVVFVLNNNGYERLLCKEPAIAYNDIAPWHYAELPHALGCDDRLTARVTTCEEFDQALQAAGKSDSGVYIEVVTDAHVASPLAMKLHDAIKTLYAS
jgi:indolepyruvate decarboxylase